MTESFDETLHVVERVSGLRRECGPTGEDEQQAEEAGGRGGQGHGGDGEQEASAASTRELKVLYTNAQSVIRKIDKLSSVASKQNPDFILLTESWCNDQISNTDLSIPGYELLQDLRKDRYDTDRGRGGGLLVYAKKEHSVWVLPTDDENGTFQSCKFKVHDVTVYLIYRSPSSGADGISGLTNMIRGAEKNVVFFGDFNLPKIDWEVRSPKGQAKELQEAAKDRSMEQLVTFATHISGNTLDLVLTDMPERVPEVTEDGRLGKSDHVIIMTKIVINGGSGRQRGRKEEDDGGGEEKKEGDVQEKKSTPVILELPLKSPGSVADLQMIYVRDSGSEAVSLDLKHTVLVKP
jgi:hypothetical protein